MPRILEDGVDRLFLVDFKEGVLTIVPLGDVGAFRWDEMEQASKAIFETLSRGPGARVLVDMGKLRYCGSILLALMLRIWKSISPQNGVLVFCNVSDEVADILRHTRLDTLWAVYPDRSSALAALTSTEGSTAPSASPVK
jgi:anti-anti-sigma factor